MTTSKVSEKVKLVFSDGLTVDKSCPSCRKGLKDTCSSVSKLEVEVPASSDWPHKSLLTTVNTNRFPMPDRNLRRHRVIRLR